MDYTRVPLMLSEDSDDEIFVKEYAKYGDLQLKLLPPKNSRKPSSPQHQKRKNRKHLSCSQIVVLILGIILLFFIIAVVIFAVIISFAPSNLPNINNVTESLLKPTHHIQSQDWKRTFQGLYSASETNIRLMDVDRDGLDDVICAVSTSSLQIAVDMPTSDHVNTPLKTLCDLLGMSFPCMGFLYALRGYDGKLLWQEKLVAAALFLNCVDFDVDKDGQKDCIVSGRMGTIHAISTRSGNTLWMADSDMVFPKWNTYQVVRLPDFDGDDVPDMLVANGGDPDKDPEDHDRSAGRLLMLSGATGKSLGERYLEMPDSRETYFTPVMYTCGDGSQYILFGSGGETIPGDLMMISLPDLYHYVMDLDGDVPGVRGKYDQWPERPRDHNNILTLYKGIKKGVMVPPVIADIDNDGINDIMASIYDGKNILYNGKNLKIMWIADFPNMESYSTPAPGHFDDDGTLDFMVHWTTGAWPIYYQSQAVILSGKTGEIIWQYDTNWYEMSSDLTLHTTQPHRDMFLYKIKGRNASFHLKGDGLLVRKEPLHSHDQHDGETSRRHRRHGGQEKPKSDMKLLTEVMVKEDYESRHLLCEENFHLSVEMFLMDRSLRDQPIKVLEVPSQPYHYVIENQNKTRGVNGSMGSPRKDTHCIVMMPKDLTTAAVGDVDGDGQLDVIALLGVLGSTVDARYSYIDSVEETYIMKVSLAPFLADGGNRVKLNVTKSPGTSQRDPTSPGPSDRDPGLKPLLPMDKQNWAEYLGTKGNSLYTGQH